MNEVTLEESVKYCFEAMNPNGRMNSQHIPLINNCLNTFYLSLRVGDEIMSEGS